jgi:signal transduction histidine kinase
MADSGETSKGYCRNMSSATPDVIGVAHRWQRRVREHQGFVDVLLAIVFAAASLVDIASVNPLDHDRDAGWLAVALVLLGAGSLIWRRRAPITVLAAAVAVLSISYARDYGSFLAVIGLAAIYSVTVHSENRRRAWAAIGAACVALVVVASFTILDQAGDFRSANAASMVISLSGIAVVGVLVRNWNQLFVDTERRAERAEADRLIEAERAVARERNRIAREMHDVVAHGMSVISVQAAAAQAIARSDPERTIKILEDIETTGRESLTEMRRMLSVLRNSDDVMNAGHGPGSLSPQPSLSDLSAATAHCTEAGIQTELVIVGDKEILPPGVELAGFRIVQEALTNVLKHGGGAASAKVEVRYSPEALELTITDTGRGAVSGISEPGGGNGLIGMRERVEVYDGELHAGPRAGGGYEVRAVLPLDASAARPVVASADAPNEEQPA